MRRDAVEGKAQARWNFGLRGLMAIPVLVAVAIAGYTALDRWTAVPWSGPEAGTPVSYQVVDVETGGPVVGARLKLMVNGLSFDMRTAAPGHIIRSGGDAIQGVDHRSLVRDTRRVNLDNTSVHVSDSGYDDFSAETSAAPLVARPAANSKSVDYVINLRRSRQ